MLQHFFKFGLFASKIEYDVAKKDSRSRFVGGDLGLHGADRWIRGEVLYRLCMGCCGVSFSSPTSSSLEDSAGSVRILYERHAALYAAAEGLERFLLKFLMFFNASEVTRAIFIQRFLLSTTRIGVSCRLHRLLVLMSWDEHESSLSGVVYARDRFDGTLGLGRKGKRVSHEW